jgi:hypothetical protein
MLFKLKNRMEGMALNPSPLEGFVPSIISEGCGFGTSYVIYLASGNVREFGLVTFNHCAAISCTRDRNDKIPTGQIYDLQRSAEWRGMHTGRGVNIGLTFGGLTWEDIHHFRITFHSCTVNAFAASYSQSFFRAEGHLKALLHCLNELQSDHSKHDQAMKEILDDL